MKPTYTIGILCCAAAACATTAPPPELLEARQAFATSQQSKAARYDPVALHEAKAALDNAESLYKSDSDSPKTRDAAYVAARRAERATVEGETVALQKQKQAIVRSEQAAKAESAQSAEAQLLKTREQLDQAQKDLKQAQLGLQAEGNASVSEEARGTVITLAGAFMFGSNKAVLRERASESVDKIAFLLKQHPDKQILIEGHTDSTGTDQRNIELSKERAETVAAQLAARGVPRDSIMTEGVGAIRPIASNDTAEGRAANRRVEITIRSDEAD